MIRDISGHFFVGRERCERCDKRSDETMLSMNLRYLTVQLKGVLYSASFLFLFFTPKKIDIIPRSHGETSRIAVRFPPHNTEYGLGTSMIRYCMYTIALTR